MAEAKRPFIRKVTGNVKEGCDVEIGERTLIVGRNGKGKSTIVNAIELAVSGAASDVAGRATIAAEADVFGMLAPAGATTLTATAEFSDGTTTASYTLDKGKRAMKLGGLPPSVLPLRAVREAILGSPETAKKFFLGMAREEPITWDRLKAQIPIALHETLDKVAHGSTSDSQKAVDALAYSRTRARERKKTAETLRENAKRMAATAPPTDEAAAKAAHAAKLADVERRIGEAGQGMSNAGAAAQAAHVTAERARAALSGLPAVDETLASVGDALLTVLAVTPPGAKCGVCGGPTEKALLDARRAKIAEKLEATRTAASARRKAENDLREAEYAEGEARADFDRWEAIEQSLRGEREALRSAAPRPDPVWEQIRGNEAQALEADREAVRWAELAEALATAVGRLVDASRAEFERRVQAFLPKEIGGKPATFGIDLLDGDRDVFRLGLRRADGKVRAALSGAEWATVTAAVTAACLPANEGNVPAIVIPEERAFDPETLTEVLFAFGKIPGQVILTSPVPPTVIPEGWTVVTVGYTEADGKPLAQTHTPERIAAVAAAVEVAPTPADGAKPKRKRRTRAEIAADAAAAAAALPPADPAGLRADPDFCPACGSVIALGKCEHGIGKGTKPPDEAVDLFD